MVKAKAGDFIKVRQYQARYGTFRLFFGRVVRLIDENATFPYVINSPVNGWSPCISEDEIVEIITEKHPAYSPLKRYFEREDIKIHIRKEIAELRAEMEAKINEKGLISVNNTWCQKEIKTKLRELAYEGVRMQG